MGFSYASCRRLRKYLGELDAMVELTELAARRFVDESRRSPDVRQFVAAAARAHSVNVNVAEVERLPRHLARHYILSVYQAAERFFCEYREEHTRLHGKPWTVDSGRRDGPLGDVISNVTRRLDSALVDRFQYYRLVRNWISHAMDRNPKQAAAAHRSLAPWSEEHRLLFKSSPEPNLPDAVTFDDFVLFSRVTKLIAEQLSQLGRPAEKHWAAVLKLDRTRFKRLLTKPARMRNAIAGRLRTEYGLDVETANKLAADAADSLAQR